MATAQLGAALRHIRSAASHQQFSGQSDGALLRAFLSGNDQPAFEALVRRHGPMVLRVCRRTLGHAQDAEDALQATFLVLARQAASIRKKESLASWLHGVAYRMATHAKRAAARRRGHEARVSPAPPKDPALRAAWQEFQVLLDEEVARLPETLREPFVASCLGDQSCADAARRLGLKEATVRKRLSRARKLLQERLTRRGVSLPAVLAAAAVGANDAGAAVPRSLVGPTVKAAADLAAGRGLAGGPVSAQVVTLVEGVSRAMFFSKCKRMVLLLLVPALVGAGLGLAARCGARAAPAARAPAPKAAGEGAKGARRQPANAPAREGVRVRGRVLDPAGKPLAGAALYLGPCKSLPYRVRATSGDDGRFRFTVAGSELKKIRADNPSPQLIAVARGYGCDWADLGSAKAELTLRLAKDVPVRGRVLDRDGRPVVGAKVRVENVAAYPGEDLTKMLEDLRRVGWRTSYGAKHWGGPLPGQARVLTTGADGRFRLAGFGCERIVSLFVEGPAIETASVTVMTRDAPAVAGMKPLEGLRQEKIYGAVFDYIPAPSRLIRGVVRDKATGKGVAGVTLWSYLTPDRPRTDREGRYELRGHPKAANYQLYLVPPDGRHFAFRVRVRDTLGLDPLTADVALPAGIPVRGRVLDQARGKPVAGVRVSYYVFFPNPRVSRLDEFPEYEGLSTALTGADGSFEVAVLPGPGLLAAAAQPASAYRPALVSPNELKDFFGRPPDRWNSVDTLTIHGTGTLARAGGPMFLNQSDYNALALLNPGEKDKGLTRDLVLLPPLTRHGTVVGPDGKPLAGARAAGLDAGAFSPDAPLKSASFTVRGLHPERTRELYFYHQEKNLGRFLEIRGAESKPLTVMLQPCGSAAGRLLDKGGKPVAGTVIYFCRQHYGPFFPGTVTVKTDRAGRFRADGLVPGQKYTMTRYTTNIRDTLPDVTGQSGTKQPLGDLVVAPVLR